MEHFGQIIRKERKRQKKTQTMVAGDIISVSTLSNIENGKITEIHPTVYNHLVSALNLSNEVFTDKKVIDKIKSLLTQASTFEALQHEKSEKIYLTIIELAQDSHLYSFKAEAHRKLGNHYFNLRRLEEAEKQLKEAMSTFSSLSSESKGEFKCKIKLAAIKFAKEKYKMALTEFEDLYAQLLGNQTLKGYKGILQYNIASTYYRLNNFNKASYFCEESIENLLPDDKEYLISSLILSSILFTRNGYYLLARTKLTKAQEYANNFNKPVLLTKILHNIGEIDNQSGNLASAKDYFSSSMELNINLNNNLGVARNKMGLAHIYLKYKEFSLSKELAEESLMLFRKANSKFDELECLILLSGVYKQLDNTSLELDSLLKANSIAQLLNRKETLFNISLKLAWFHKSKNNPEKCNDYLHKALTLKTEVSL
ncbi:helix-turn-helix domain-containing protein [Bacillus sp. FJAT-45037]|uniref:helix-turn-helix domain-containing protein n=1 Tax=Bacillus sp. FJAT-45037 TaxID=2011007 RepID=UPI000C24D62B|nr:helix-turn-helix transcriptional regulator [Bacillus sp. FJAT-45037]